MLLRFSIFLLFSHCRMYFQNRLLPLKFCFLLLIYFLLLVLLQISSPEFVRKSAWASLTFLLLSLLIFFYWSFILFIGSDNPLSLQQSLKFNFFGVLIAVLYVGIECVPMTSPTSFVAGLYLHLPSFLSSLVPYLLCILLIAFAFPSLVISGSSSYSFFSSS